MAKYLFSAPCFPPTTEKLLNSGKAFRPNFTRVVRVNDISGNWRGSPEASGGGWEGLVSAGKGHLDHAKGLRDRLGSRGPGLFS